MKLVFRNLLLLLAFGLCFKPTDAEDLNTASTTDTSLEKTAESFSATPVNNNTKQTPDTDFPQTTMVYQQITLPEELTTENTTPLKPETVETSLETVSETTTSVTVAQTVQTTMTATTVLEVETTVNGRLVSEATSTSPYETTVDFVSPTEGITTVADVQTTGEITTAAAVTPTGEITTVAAVNPTEEITTVAAVNPTEEITTMAAVTPTEEIMPTDLTEALTSIMPDPTVSPTVPVVDPIEEDASTTMFPTSDSEFDPVTTTTPAEDPIVSFANNESLQNNLLWIIIVCAVAICALCVVMIALVQWRKKKASQSFGPAYANGQSKRSKKKKGAEDPWAGPVNLEAGLECDAEAQEGLLPNDGKQDGDDVVLSTFAALDEVLDMSDGGVGGEGTKEAQKWEEQEPMPFIDEEVDENKEGKTPAVNEKMNGVLKSEEKELNGGEAFCITTAV